MVRDVTTRFLLILVVLLAISAALAADDVAKTAEKALAQLPGQTAFAFTEIRDGHPVPLYKNARVSDWPSAQVLSSTFLARSSRK